MSYACSSAAAPCRDSKEHSSVVLYVHIPKAGGTALNDWLYEQIKSDGAREVDGWLCSGVFYYPSGYVHGPYPRDKACIDRVLARVDLRAVVGHFHYGLHTRLTQQSTYITVLRNPTDRVISLFHFQRLVEEVDGSHQGIRLPQDITLSDFVENPPYPEVDNGQVRRLAGTYARQGACTRMMLEDACDNLVHHFAAVGLTERLEESCQLFKARLGLDRDIPLYAKNTNPSRPKQLDLDSNLLTFIAERNHLDWELYEFAAGLFEQACHEVLGNSPSALSPPTQKANSCRGSD